MCYYIDQKEGSCLHCDHRFKKHKKQELVIHLSNIEIWMMNKQKQIQSESVVFYSQLYLKEQDLLCCATPNYCNTGSWYDWVLVNFINLAEELVQYPFKIFGFVSKDDSGGLICFGQMCATQTTSTAQYKTSCRGFFEHWHLLNIELLSQKVVHPFVELKTKENSCLIAIQLSKYFFKNSGNVNEFPDMFYDSNIPFTNKVIRLSKIK
jgi:hypothetical protein